MQLENWVGGWSRANITQLVNSNMLCDEIMLKSLNHFKPCFRINVSKNLSEQWALVYDVFCSFTVLSFFQTLFAAQLHCIHRRRRRRSATCKEYMPNRRRYKDIKDINVSFGAKVWPVMKSNLSLMSGCHARPAGFIQFLGMPPHSSIIWMLLLDGFKFQVFFS